MAMFIVTTIYIGLILVPNLEHRDTPKLQLRSESKTIRLREIEKVAREKDFFIFPYNIRGKGINHTYQLKFNGAIVYDDATGLYWQQSGSKIPINSNYIEGYIHSLNQTKYAGYSDWRLPTLEEAMSLLGPVKNKYNLFIDTIFDSSQKYIWTSDTYPYMSIDNDPSLVFWCLVLDQGACMGGSRLQADFYVRAVRSDKIFISK